MHLFRLGLFCSFVIFLLFAPLLTHCAENDSDSGSFEDDGEDVINVNNSRLSATTTSSSTTTTTTTPAPRQRKVKNPFLQVRGPSRHHKSSPVLNTSSTDETVQRKPLTREANKSSPLLKKIHDYLIVVLLVAVMFAMGCSITWSQVSYRSLNFFI